MRTLIKFLAAALVLSGIFSSCDRRQVIPDDKLTEILKEVYLANAYVSTEQVNMDSADIYRPIFGKYGYNIEDLKYTIENFSRRKSSRLSDVMNEVVSRLESEYNAYAGRVAVLDTLDARAARLFNYPAYEDSVISARRIADTSALRITLPVSEGVYEVSYNYLLDPLDENRSLRTTYTLIDTLGKRRLSNNQWLRTGRDRKQNLTVKINTGREHAEMEILFGNYPARDMKRPHLTIDSLRVTRYLARGEARDSLLRYLLDYKFILDGQELRSMPKDSVTLAIDVPRAAPGRDTVH